MNLSSHEALLTVASHEGDPLETIVRRGAKLLLQAALEAEVTEDMERQKHARRAGEELRGYRSGGFTILEAMFRVQASACFLFAQQQAAQQQAEA